MFSFRARSSSKVKANGHVRASTVDESRSTVLVQTPRKSKGEASLLPKPSPTLQLSPSRESPKRSRTLDETTFHTSTSSTKPKPTPPRSSSYSSALPSHHTLPPSPRTPPRIEDPNDLYLAAVSNANDYNTTVPRGRVRVVSGKDALKTFRSGVRKEILTKDHCENPYYVMPRRVV